MEDLGFQFNPEKFYKPKGRLFSSKGKKDPLSVDGLLEGQEPETDLDEIPVESGFSFYFLYFLVFSIFFVLFFRAFQLQIIQGENYKKKAEFHSLREIILRAPRGLIYDRSFDPKNPQKGLLVKNIPSFSFAVIPADLPQSNEEKENLFKEIALSLKLDVEDIKKAVEEQKDIYQPAIIKKNLSKQEALVLEKQFSQKRGVRILNEPLREYIDGIYFSHVIGYTGKINEEEYAVLKEKGYDLNATVGKAGLEKSYEEYLHGIDGKEVVEVDALGNVVKKLGTIEPQPGAILVSTIDANLQKKTYEALNKIATKTGSKKAAAVALDPRTGEVLAMVSIPSFDNNIFAQGRSKEIQKLFSDPLQPLFNRVIGGTYSTGSIIKPIVAVAALSEGIITTATRIFDKGYISIPNPYIQGIVYTYKCWKAGGHGSENVIEAIRDSCNVFFYTIGGGFGDQKGLGPEKLAFWFSKFGLGKKTGIDLDGEADGFIPTPAWKKATYNEEWYLGDTYNLSIGQGNLLATPLQAALFTSAIANGGMIFKPHLVKKIVDADGNIIQEFKPQLVAQNIVDKKNLEYVKEGMYLVVQQGTAQALSSLKVKVAGKTGTTQIGGQTKETHSWFVCFAPYSNPQIALAVIVEKGGYGAEAALPVAKEILEFYFK